MIRRISPRSQRVPMVDAGTLDDRTRPLSGAPPPLTFRLGYYGQPDTSVTLHALREKRRAQATLGSRALR